MKKNLLEEKRGGGEVNNFQNFSSMHIRNGPLPTRFYNIDHEYKWVPVAEKRLFNFFAWIHKETKPDTLFKKVYE